MAEQITCRHWLETCTLEIFGQNCTFVNRNGIVSELLSITLEDRFRENRTSSSLHLPILFRSVILKEANERRKQMDKSFFDLIYSAPGHFNELIKIELCHALSEAARWGKVKPEQVLVLSGPIEKIDGKEFQVPKAERAENYRGFWFSG